jgi:hypothetical protein
MFTSEVVKLHVIQEFRLMLCESVRILSYLTHAVVNRARNKW